jgi:hypothetical protein
MLPEMSAQLPLGISTYYFHLEPQGIRSYRRLSGQKRVQCSHDFDALDPDPA